MISYSANQKKAASYFGNAIRLVFLGSALYSAGGLLNDNLITVIFKNIAFFICLGWAIIYLISFR